MAHVTAHTAQDAPFITAAATGADWRAVTRAVLAQLQGREEAVQACTIGFLYMTDALGDDATSILDLVRTVTGVKHWVGAMGVGVVAQGVSYVDEPALSLMVGAVPPEDFCIFPAVDLDISPATAALQPWLDRREPMLVLMHGDPLSDNDPSHTLAELAAEIGGFSAGGLASARGQHLQIADNVVEGGLSGVAFAAEVEVSTTLSQGCAPLGTVHEITRCRDNMVLELDGRPAYEVFAEELRHLASAGGPSTVRAEDGTINIKGEVHVAFPVPGRDQRDYLVRHALGLDPDEGWIAVSWPVREGAPMMFVHRDDATVQADLSRALVELRQRVTREKGAFAPRGALYISCVARAGADFGAQKGEMALVQEILGDVPLTGFYANGEIANAYLYGYTAVVILFL